MQYIDTDILIHSLVNQNSVLHLKATELLETAIKNDNLIVSLLNLQEIGFVLAKLGQPVTFVSARLKFLMALAPVEYKQAEFERALQLAEIIGFKHFNDCLHTAIAEQHCTDIYTCNYKDFRRIAPHSILNIHFL